MEYQHCPKIQSPSLRDQPLLAVISQWFHDNHDLYIDFSPGAIIYFGFLSFLAWFLIKIFYRIIRSLVKPFLIIGGLLIIIYTKQFSYSEDAFQFVLNVLTNTMFIFSKVLETVLRVVFGVEG